jgi:uncharacterized membrane protein
MTEEPDVPMMESSDVTSDDRLWAAVGYPIGLIAIIMLFIEGKKSRPFIKYHAWQAIAFNVVLFVVYAIMSVTVVLTICIPFLWLVTLWPAYKAYKGEWMVLPVITDFLKNQGWTKV